MLARNGAQLAHGVQPIAARSFYGALWRWSRVACTARGRDARESRREYASAATDGRLKERGGSRPEWRIRDGAHGGETLQESDIFESSGIWGQKGWQAPPTKRHVGAYASGESRDMERSQKAGKSLEGGWKRVSVRRNPLATLGESTRLRRGPIESARTGDEVFQTGAGEPNEQNADNVAALEAVPEEPSGRSFRLRGIESGRIEAAKLDSQNLNSRSSAPEGRSKKRLKFPQERGDFPEQSSGTRYIDFVSRPPIRAKIESWSIGTKDHPPAIPTMSNEKLLRLYYALGKTLSLSPDVPNPIEERRPSKKVSDRTKKLSGDVRNLMRMVTHPVAVVTTTAKPIPRTETKPEISEVVSEFRGMTISSLTTVSLDPEPIISFNIRTPSSTLDALQVTRYFYVHLIKQTGNGCEIARAFTKGNGAGATSGNPFQTPGSIWTLAGPPGDAPTSGGYLPLPTRGTNFALRCEVLSKEDRAGCGGGDGIIKVGDHVIVLAKVHAIQPEWKNPGGFKDWRILCYQHGGFVGTKSMSSTLRVPERKYSRIGEGKEEVDENRDEADGHPSQEN